MLQSPVQCMLNENELKRITGKISGIVKQPKYCKTHFDQITMAYVHVNGIFSFPQESVNQWTLAHVLLGMELGWRQLDVRQVLQLYLYSQLLT